MATRRRGSLRLARRRVEDQSRTATGVAPDPGRGRGGDGGQVPKQACPNSFTVSLSGVSLCLAGERSKIEPGPGVAYPSRGFAVGATRQRIVRGRIRCGYCDLSFGLPGVECSWPTMLAPMPTFAQEASPAAGANGARCAAEPRDVEELVGLYFGPEGTPLATPERPAVDSETELPQGSRSMRRSKRRQCDAGRALRLLRRGPIRSCLRTDD